MLGKQTSCDSLTSLSLWLQKLVLLHFFLTNFHPEERTRRYILWYYSAVFFATYAAAQIVGFTECDPFHLYWQVVPAPGSCVQAQVQLVVLGVLNIVSCASCRT